MGGEAGPELEGDESCKGKCDGTTEGVRERGNSRRGSWGKDVGLKGNQKNRGKYSSLMLERVAELPDP